MNCEEFQNELFEYAEGSLATGEQAAADEHLAQCSACRQAVDRERQTTQFLSEGFRRNVESLVLRPEIRRRILAEAEGKSATQSPSGMIVGLWQRFAWPLGIAAALVVVAAIAGINHFSGARRVDHGAGSVVFSEDSYQVPIHKFRVEGNLVTDNISYETVVVSETLWVEKPTHTKPKNKVTL
jgi:anti-sigma factor RsiW